MGKDSKIETFNQWSHLTVLLFVAYLAQCDPVRDIEPQFGVVGKWLDVMGVKIPATRIAAPLASEVVTAEHVKAPSLVLHRKALVTALRQLAVFVRVAFLTARRSLTSYGANLPSGLYCVLFADAVRWAILGRFTHLLSGFFTHLFPLHRGDERFPALYPCFAEFSFGFFAVCHTTSIH